MYYHTCPKCGSNLDPGETCDCENSLGGANVEENIVADLSGDAFDTDGTGVCSGGGDGYRATGVQP